MSCRSARPRSLREGTTSRSWRSPTWCHGRCRRPNGSPRTASPPRSSTCARWFRSTPQAILRSVAKTSRLYTVEENPRLCGWGAEISSIVSEEAFWDLDGPVVRISTPHIPLPAAEPLEDMAIPIGRPHLRDGHTKTMG